MAVARFSYPDDVRAMIEGEDANWTSGGEFASFSDAIDAAKAIAEERNMPIRVESSNIGLTVYPESIGY